MAALDLLAPFQNCAGLLSSKPSPDPSPSSDSSATLLPLLLLLSPPLLLPAASKPGSHTPPGLGRVALLLSSGAGTATPSLGALLAPLLPLLPLLIGRVGRGGVSL
jgi:hypothetical protein